jgi:hypothetical protein
MELRCHIRQRAQKKPSNILPNTITRTIVYTNYFRLMIEHTRLKRLWKKLVTTTAIMSQWNLDGHKNGSVYWSKHRLRRRHPWRCTFPVVLCWITSWVLCNHVHHSFDCDGAEQSDKYLDSEFEKCGITANVETRLDSWLIEHESTALKCFDPMPPSRYIDYMGNFLQRRRIETEFIPIATNSKRNKTKECLWNASPEFQLRVKNRLLEKYVYFQFCQDCMGSVDELPLLDGWKKKRENDN